MNVPHDPYRRPGVHYPEELGAHVLGLLDPVQSYAVEEHLAGCPACRREWEELRGMVDVLDYVPPEAALEGPPDADLMLRRTLRQVRKEGGAQRRRRRFAGAGVAAAVIGVVLVGGVQLGRETVPPLPVTPPVAAEPSGDSVVLTGGGAPGVSMTTTITPAAGWVRLTTSVQGIPPGQRCYVVVEARDGTREIAGSWVVSPAGSVTLDGSALVPIDDVAAVVVENDEGREFATART
jgi:Putative zinc-finger